MLTGRRPYFPTNAIPVREFGKGLRAQQLTGNRQKYLRRRLGRNSEGVLTVGLTLFLKSAPCAEKVPGQPAHA